MNGFEYRTFQPTKSVSVRCAPGQEPVEALRGYHLMTTAMATDTADADENASDQWLGLAGVLEYLIAACPTTTAAGMAVKANIAAIEAFNGPRGSDRKILTVEEMGIPETLDQVLITSLIADLEAAVKIEQGGEAQS